MRIPADNPVQLYTQATRAFERGDWPSALDFASRAAAHAPRHGGVHFLAGAAALQLGRVPLALEYLQHAVRQEPHRVAYRAQFARALATAHRMPEAIAQADTASQAPDPDVDAATCDTLGVVYSKANAHDRAAEAFGRAVAKAPRNANYRFNLATSFMYFGDFDAAEREYQACLSLDSRYWRAYLALSQLRKQTPARNHVGMLESALARHGGDRDPDALLHLHLALAKETEDLGDTDRAFAHYTAGKAAHRDRVGSSAQRDAAVFDAIERFFDAPMPESTGHGSGEPIFVFGMPRTGTTLVDRILSSHGDVQSAGELGHFAAALLRFGGPARTLAEAISRLDPAAIDWAALGRAYVESTRPLTGHAPHFVDKLPHNFLYAGFIARALPKAKLVCLRRDPIDTCLSNFRQLFSPESQYHAYSFDLLDTGRYYLRFDRLVKRWRALLGDRMLELDYERLVSAQEATTRELLAFCGLPWDPACLTFHEARGAVPTASAVQVRSALNDASVHRWRRYEPHLSALRRLLEDGGALG